MVNKGRVAVLVAALRSGLYERGTGFLHKKVTGPDGARQDQWCCLGVASDVAAKFGLELERSDVPMSEITAEQFDGKMDYMPSSVCKWYGIPEMNPPLMLPDGTWLLAAAANDAWDVHGQLRFSNAEIADAFERTFLAEAHDDAG